MENMNMRYHNNRYSDPRLAFWRKVFAVVVIGASVGLLASLFVTLEMMFK